MMIRVTLLVPGMELSPAVYVSIATLLFIFLQTLEFEQSRVNLSSTCTVHMHYISLCK